MDIVHGTVISGEGDYARWITLYQADYWRKTGMRLYPGTLNIRLAHPYHLPVAQISRLEPSEYGGTIGISILPVRILSRAGVVLRPDLPAGATPEEADQRLAMLEVATDIKLRDAYGLKDGDTVTIEVS